MNWLSQNWVSVVGCVYAVCTILGHCAPKPLSDVLLAVGFDISKLFGGVNGMVNPMPSDDSKK